eukprot:2861987-Rhodomonas_salina.1
MSPALLPIRGSTFGFAPRPFSVATLPAFPDPLNSSAISSSPPTAAAFLASSGSLTAANGDNWKADTPPSAESCLSMRGQLVPQLLLWSWLADGTN